MKCVNTKKFILLLKFAFKMVSFFLVFFSFFGFFFIFCYWLSHRGDSQIYQTGRYWYLKQNKGVYMVLLV